MDTDLALLEYVRDRVVRIREYTGGGRAVFFESHLDDGQLLTPTLLLLEIVQRYHRRIVHLEGNLSAVAHRANAANEELMLLEKLGLTGTEEIATSKGDPRNRTLRHLAELRETRKAWYS